MHVAKYWRNKKLRYRMIRVVKQNASERAAAEANTLGFSRAQVERDRRVRAVS